MRSRILKAISLIFLPLIFIALFLAFLVIKSTNQYRPSIYNYESYLAPSIINKLKSKYNFKEFKEISEFTQALLQDKAIAGIGSDFQAAQLILDRKIQKIDFSLVYGEKYKDWKERQFLYTPNVREHILRFDALILNILESDKSNKYKNFEIKKNKEGKPIAFRDKLNNNSKEVWDHFYDYIIPYFTQDKGIAYNINPKTRPNLNINNAIEKLDKNDKIFSWNEILQILSKNNYTHFGWTHAYLDNMMIGAFNSGEKWEEVFTKKIGDNKIFDFNESNYKLAIDSFINFVKNSTGNDIKNNKKHYFSGDGLELLNHLIEPKTSRSDASIMYNGDALDAFYSEDNFQSVESGLIRFIRPKNTYMLMDNWIISKSLSKKETTTFLKAIRDHVINIDKHKNNIQNIEKIFFNQFKNNMTKQLKQSAEASFFETIHNIDKTLKNKLIQEFLKNKEFFNINEKSTSFEEWNSKKFREFLKNPTIQENYEWFLIWRNNYQDHNEAFLFDDLMSDAFANSEIGSISNFDYVSYTPTEKVIYDFIKKWYFGSNKVAISIFDQPESNNNYQVFSYPIIDNNLRTKIITYYYEKTKS